MFCFECNSTECIKMYKIVNTFLMVGDKFKPEMNLKQPGFTYSACGPFTKRKKRIEKFMQIGNTDFIYKNELDKAYFQHNIVYGKSKDLTKRTKSDKFLRDQEFQTASDLKYDGYQKELASMVTSFLIKCLVKVVLTLRLQISLLLNQIINFQMNLIDRLLGNLRNEKFIHPLETIFEVLM